MCGMLSSAEMSKAERDYRAEDDVRTLERAREIQTDKGRMTACRRLAKKRIATYRSFTGGRRGKR